MADSVSWQVKTVSSVPGNYLNRVRGPSGRFAGSQKLWLPNMVVNPIVNAAGFLAGRTLEQTLSRLADAAEGYAPMVTGLLKSSIGYTVSPEGTWGTFGADLNICPYAGFVNFGTSMMPGAHFLEAAVDEVIVAGR